MITAILSNKGGVGKSSLATNLTAANALKFKEPTLLIDVDGQVNSTYSFVDPKSVKHNGMYDVFIGEKQLEDIIIEVQENLFLAPASEKLNELEFKILTNLKQYPNYFDLLKGMDTSKFSQVFFDLPPSLGLTTANVLSISNRVCIPYVPETFAVWGLVGALNMIKETQEHVNPELRISGIIGNKVDKRLKTHMKLLNECQVFCKERGFNFFNTVIPNHSKFPQSLDDLGKPAVLAALEDKKFRTAQIKKIYSLLEEIREA